MVEIPIDDSALPTHVQSVCHAFAHQRDNPQDFSQYILDHEWCLCFSNGSLSITQKTEPQSQEMKQVDAQTGHKIYQILNKLLSNDPDNTSYQLAKEALKKTYDPITSTHQTQKKQLAIILGDSFIRHTSLEGATFSQIHDLWRDALKENPQLCGAQSETIVQALDHTLSLSNCKDVPSLQKKLKQELEQSKQNSILIHGGWPGHAVLYEICRNEQGKYTFLIHNSGQGSQHHPTIYREGRQLCSSLVIEHVASKDLLHPRFLTSLFDMYYTTNMQESQEDLIEKFYYTLIHRLKGQPKILNDYCDEDFKKIQESGTCSYRSLLAYLHKKMPPKAYKTTKTTFQSIQLRKYLDISAKYVDQIDDTSQLAEEIEFLKLCQQKIHDSSWKKLLKQARTPLFPQDLTQQLEALIQKAQAKALSISPPLPHSIEPIKYQTHSTTAPIPSLSTTHMRVEIPQGQKIHQLLPKQSLAILCDTLKDPSISNLSKSILVQNWILQLESPETFWNDSWDWNLQSLRSLVYVYQWVQTMNPKQTLVQPLEWTCLLLMLGRGVEIGALCLGMGQEARQDTSFIKHSQAFVYLEQQKISSSRFATLQHALIQHITKLQSCHLILSPDQSFQFPEDSTIDSVMAQWLAHSDRHTIKNIHQDNQAAKNRYVQQIKQKHPHMTHIDRKKDFLEGFLPPDFCSTTSNPSLDHKILFADIGPDLQSRHTSPLPTHWFASENSDLSSPEKKFDSSVSSQKTGESLTSRKGSELGDLGSESTNESISSRSGSVASISSEISAPFLIWRKLCLDFTTFTIPQQNESLQWQLDMDVSWKNNPSEQRIDFASRASGGPTFTQFPRRHPKPLTPYLTMQTDPARLCGKTMSKGRVNTLQRDLLNILSYPPTKIVSACNLLENQAPFLLQQENLLLIHGIFFDDNQLAKDLHNPHKRALILSKITHLLDSLEKTNALGNNLVFHAHLVWLRASIEALARQCAPDSSIDLGSWQHLQDLEKNIQTLSLDHDQEKLSYLTMTLMASYEQLLAIPFDTIDANTLCQVKQVDTLYQKLPLAQTESVDLKHQAQKLSESLKLYTPNLPEGSIKTTLHTRMTTETLQQLTPFLGTHTHPHWTQTLTDNGVHIHCSPAHTLILEHGQLSLQSPPKPPQKLYRIHPDHRTPALDALVEAHSPEGVFLLDTKTWTPQFRVNKNQQLERIDSPHSILCQYTQGPLLLVEDPKNLLCQLDRQGLDTITWAHTPHMTLVRLKDSWHLANDPSWCLDTTYTSHQTRKGLHGVVFQNTHTKARKLFLPNYNIDNTSAPQPDLFTPYRYDTKAHLQPDLFTPYRYDTKAHLSADPTFHEYSITPQGQWIPKTRQGLYFLVRAYALEGESLKAFELLESVQAKSRDKLSEDEETLLRMLITPNSYQRQDALHATLCLKAALILYENASRYGLSQKNLWNPKESQALAMYYHTHESRIWHTKPLRVEEEATLRRLLNRTQTQKVEKYYTPCNPITSWQQITQAKPNLRELDFPHKKNIFRLFYYKLMRRWKIKPCTFSSPSWQKYAPYIYEDLQKNPEKHQDLIRGLVAYELMHTPLEHLWNPQNPDLALNILLYTHQTLQETNASLSIESFFPIHPPNARQTLHTQDIHVLHTLQEPYQTPLDISPQCLEDTVTPDIFQGWFRRHTKTQTKQELGQRLFAHNTSAYKLYPETFEKAKQGFISTESVKTYSLESIQIEQLHTHIASEEEKLLAIERLLCNTIESVSKSSQAAYAFSYSSKSTPWSLEKLALAYTSPHPDEAIEQMLATLNKEGKETLRKALLAYFHKTHVLAHLKRIRDDLEQLPNDDLTSQHTRTQRIGAAMESFHAYSLDDPHALIYLLFETKGNLTIRHAQKEAIQDLLQTQQGHKAIELIMNSGKSFAIQPLLALMNAKSGKLSTVLVPEHLVPQVTAHLSFILQDSFDRPFHVLNLSEADVADPQRIQQILKDLKQAQKQGHVILLTTKDLYLIESAYISSDTTQEIHKLRTFIKTAQQRQVDEPDTSLDPQTVYKKVMGTPQPLDTKIALSLATLVSHLVTNRQIQQTISLDFANKWRQSQGETLDPSRSVFTQTLYQEIIQPQLLNYITQHIQSPNSPLYIRTKISNQDLSHFLLQPHGPITFPQQHLLSEQEQELLGALGLFIRDTLPQCLEKTCCANYDFDFPHKHTFVASPFKGPQMPKTTHFGDVLEQAAYSMQALFYQGIPQEMASKILFSLGQALTENPSEQSEEYQLLEKIYPQMPSFKELTTLPHSQDLLAPLCQKTHQDASFLTFAFLHHIAPDLKQTRQNLVLNPEFLMHSVPKESGSQLYSGTLQNAPMPLHTQPLEPKPNTSSVDAQVLSALFRQGNLPHHFSHTPLDDTIEAFAKDDNLFLFMDSGGWIQDEGAEHFAHKLLTQVHESRPQITQVLFHDAHGKLQLFIHNPDHTVTQIPYDPQSRQTEMSNTLTVLTRIYEVGTHIPQPPQSKGLISIRKDMTPEIFFQALLRLRDLLTTQQMEVAFDPMLIAHMRDQIPDLEQKPSVEDLCRFLYINQAQIEEKKQFLSIQQKLQFLAFDLLDTPEHFKLAQEVATETSHTSFYQRFTTPTPQTPQQALDDYKQRLEKILLKSKNPQIIQQFTDQTTSLPKLSTTRPVHRQSTTQVEKEQQVEQQQHVEKRVNKHIEIQQFPGQTMPYPYSYLPLAQNTPYSPQEFLHAVHKQQRIYTLAQSQCSFLKHMPPQKLLYSRNLIPSPHLQKVDESLCFGGEIFSFDSLHMQLHRTPANYLAFNPQDQTYILVSEQDACHIQQGIEVHNAPPLVLLDTQGTVVASNTATHQVNQTLQDALLIPTLLLTKLTFAQIHLSTEELDLLKTYLQQTPPLKSALENHYKCSIPYRHQDTLIYPQTPLGALLGIKQQLFCKF